MTLLAMAPAMLVRAEFDSVQGWLDRIGIALFSWWLASFFWGFLFALTDSISSAGAIATHYSMDAALAVVVVSTSVIWFLVTAAMERERRLQADLRQLDPIEPAQ